jgi:hypothetical protein
VIGLTAYVWLMPIVVAAFVGLWAGWRSDVTAPAGLFRTLGFTALVVAAVVYAGQMLWLAALVNSAQSMDSVALWSGKLTVATAMLWLPIMVIAFLGAALWRRRVA